MPSRCVRGSWSGTSCQCRMPARAQKQEAGHKPHVSGCSSLLLLCTCRQVTCTDSCGSVLRVTNCMRAAKTVQQTLITTYKDEIPEHAHMHEFLKSPSIRIVADRSVGFRGGFHCITVLTSVNRHPGTIWDSDCRHSFGIIS